MFILKSYSILRKLRGLFCRSSHRSCSVEKGVLRNFAKFTGKHLCHLFFNKIALKKRLWHTHVFSCEFCKLSKNTFFVEHLWATASVFILWINSLKRELQQQTPGFHRKSKEVLKSDSHLPKKSLFYLLQWKLLKNDEKSFLFHIKSSLLSQDIQILVLTFWSCRISKFTTSQPC